MGNQSTSPTTPHSILCSGPVVQVPGTPVWKCSPPVLAMCYRGLCSSSRLPSAIRHRDTRVHPRGPASSSFFLTLAKDPVMLSIKRKVQSLATSF